MPNQLDGLKVVIDGAHGAASMVSPEVFRLAGAEVVEIGTSPDGLNINDGVGSTHLDPLTRRPSWPRAVGIAHDGDADRCLAVDATDRASTATRSWRSSPWRCKERGQLADDTLVATVMSNLGLHAGDAARGHPREDRRRSATATCSRRCAQVATRSGASSPAT